MSVHWPSKLNKKRYYLWWYQIYGWQGTYERGNLLATNYFEVRKVVSKAQCFWYVSHDITGTTEKQKSLEYTETKT